MNKEINSILGNRLKTLRKAKGYTKEAFAENINVSSRFLADVECGKVGVSITTLKLIAQNLNVSADYLLGLTDINDDDFEKTFAIEKLNKFSNNQLKKINTILDCITDLTD